MRHRIPFGSGSVRIRLGFGSNSILIRFGFGSDSIRIRFGFGSDSVRVRFGFGSDSDSVRIRFGYGSDSIRVRFGLGSDSGRGTAQHGQARPDSGGCGSRQFSLVQLGSALGRFGSSLRGWAAPTANLFKMQAKERPPPFKEKPSLLEY